MRQKTKFSPARTVPTVNIFLLLFSVSDSCPRQDVMTSAGEGEKAKASKLSEPEQPPLNVSESDVFCRLVLLFSLLSSLYAKKE